MSNAHHFSTRFESLPVGRFAPVYIGLAVGRENSGVRRKINEVRREICQTGGENLRSQNVGKDLLDDKV